MLEAETVGTPELSQVLGSPQVVLGSAPAREPPLTPIPCGLGAVAAGGSGSTGGSGLSPAGVCGAGDWVVLGTGAMVSRIQSRRLVMRV